MSSSRRTRRRRQQRSFQRHQLRLEGLEKRYALDAVPSLSRLTSPEFNSVNEDAGIPVGQVGTLVSDLIDTGGTHNNFSDADGDLPGIAITGVNLQGGTLYYSRNDGGTWSDVGSVSGSLARVLHADSVTRVAFQPPEDFIGTISDVLTFKAWDRTGGYANGEAGVPAIPPVTGTLDTSGEARSVTLSPDGNTAYVADYLAGLQIINVSDSSNPTLIETFDTPGYAESVTLSPDGNTAYVGYHSDGIHIIDVSDSSNPTLIETFHASGWQLGVTLSSDGNTAYVADSFTGLRIIDVSDSSNPALTGILDTSGSAGDVVLSPDGNTAYVTTVSLGSTGENYVHIIDVSGSSTPTLISTLEISTTGQARHITLSPDGSTAYVTGNSVHIIDVSDSSNPTLIERFNAFGSELGVTLSPDGNTAYVAASGVLQVIDVSDPNNPALIGIFDTPGNARDVTLSPDGKTAYVADEGSGLQIIDIDLVAEEFSPATDTVSITVDPVNDAPTGSVVISGIAEEDQTLTAANDLADIDGLGVISYQWSRDGDEIRGATANTYTLVQADVGKAITATASYTDNYGTLESVVSSATSTVVNVIDSPLGEVTIDGEPTQNVVLSANTSAIQDEDGLGELSYQWLRNGIPVSGANSSTHTLTQDDVGTYITVRVDWVDNEGIAKSLTSDQTLAVVNVTSTVIEDAGVPVGQVGMLVSEAFSLDAAGIAITGTNLQGGTLYYSIDDGAIWLDVGSVSESFARLLYRDGTTRLALSPASNFNGTIIDAITAKAWNGTSDFSNGEPGVVTTISLASTYDYQPTHGKTFGLALSPDGSTAYTSDFAKFLIVDVRDPSSPAFIEEVLLNDSVEEHGSITLSNDGNTAYVATESDLSIIDVNDPVNPTVTGTLSMSWTDSDQPNELTLSPDGSKIYAVTEYGNVHIVDVSDPVNPILLGHYDTDSRSAAPGLRLSSNGDIAYLAYSGGLDIIDVSDPANPSLLSEIDDGVFYGLQLSADGDTLYTLTRDNFLAIDVSDSINPTFRPSRDTNSPRNLGDSIESHLAWPHDFVITPDEKTAYAAFYKHRSSSDVGPRGYILEIDLPTDGYPRVISAVSTQDHVYDTALSTDSNTLFVTGGWASGNPRTSGSLQIFNLDRGRFPSASITANVHVAVANDLPTGTVLISGIAEEDQTLTATNDLADVDGLGVISYEWSRDGVEISGATANTYMLVQADVGKTITATASYTDNDGTLESVTSASTSASYECERCTRPRSCCISTT